MDMRSRVFVLTFFDFLYADISEGFMLVRVGVFLIDLGKMLFF